MTDSELIKLAERIKTKMLQDTSARLASIMDEIKALVRECPLHYKADLLRSIDLVLYRNTNFNKRFHTGLISENDLMREEQKTVQFLLDILDPIIEGDVKSLDRILSPSDTKMTFDLEFESMTLQERQHVIDSINSLTFGEQGIKIKRVDKGSVILTLELGFPLFLRWYSLATSGILKYLIDIDDNIIQTNIEHSLLAKFKSIEFDITSSKQKFAETFIETTGHQLYDLNLSRLNLRGIRIPYANLSGSNLLAASLIDSSLPFANLNNTYLVDCSFQFCNLEQTSFENAYAQSANFKSVNFGWANLQGADFRYSNLQGAWLNEANLQYCKLQKADLTGANFSHADLREAVIVDAILSGSRWEETRVDGMVMDIVQFEYLQKQPVDLSKVHVVGTNSSRALVSLFSSV